jgi:hypothetical protein
MNFTIFSPFRGVNVNRGTIAPAAGVAQAVGQKRADPFRVRGPTLAVTVGQQAATASAAASLTAGLATTSARASLIIGTPNTTATVP